MALWDTEKQGEFVDTRKIKTRVAIVGSGATKDLVPYDEKDLEIWGLNEGYEYMQRIDKHFQIHEWNEIENNRKDPEHLARLQGMVVPIYMQQKHDHIPTSEEYPLNEMIGEFGEVFSGTVDYMVALAMMRGYKTIEFYGVEMEAYSEYTTQRPTLYYLLGIAKERGIEIVIPEESKLMNKILYGFQHKEIKEVDVDIFNLKEKRIEFINATNDMAMMNGFMKAVQEMEKGSDIDALKKETETEVENMIAVIKRLEMEKEGLEKVIEEKTGKGVKVSAPDVKLQ